MALHTKKKGFEVQTIDGDVGAARDIALAEQHRRDRTIRWFGERWIISYCSGLWVASRMNDELSKREYRAPGGYQRGQ